MGQLSCQPRLVAAALLVAALGGAGCGGGGPSAGTDASSDHDRLEDAGGVAGAAGRAEAGARGPDAGLGGGDATGAAGAGGAATSTDAGTGGAGAAGTGGAGAGGAAAGGAGAGAGAGGATGARCQTPWAGDLQLGTAADDQVLGMDVDGDDDLIVSGYEQGVVGVSNIEPDGDARAIVLKLGPSGATLWKTVLDTSAADTAEDVAVDRASGDLVVVGRTSGAFPSFTNQGQFDLFVALLEPGGQVTSLLQAGNERPQHPVRLSLVPGGSVLVAGWDDTYIPTNYVAANQDGFFAAFTTGPGPGHAFTETSMQYTFPSSMTGPFSLATGVAAEQDGSGASYVTTLAASARSPENGISVTKFDAHQSVVWNQVISPDSFDAVNAVGLSPAGELFVTGGTLHTLGAQAFGQEDAFVMKIDKTTGTPLWTAQAGGPDSDYPTALGFDAAGNVYIAGITLGSVSASVPNQGSNDLFAMKFSPMGELLAVWQRGTSEDDELTSLAVDSCGRAFVGGYTRGALVAGQPSSGGEDMFVLNVKF